MKGGGGVNGEKVTLALGNARPSPQAGIEAAKRLVETDKVNAIIGALSSGVTIPVAAQVTVPAGVLQISTASTSPEITTLKDNDVLFRPVPTHSLPSPPPPRPFHPAEGEPHAAEARLAECAQAAAQRHQGADLEPVGRGGTRPPGRERNQQGNEQPERLHATTMLSVA